MADTTDCAKIISDLAKEYERSTSLLAQLEEALQSRTPASNLNDAYDESTRKQDQEANSASTNTHGTPFLNPVLNSVGSSSSASSDSDEYENGTDNADLALLTSLSQRRHSIYSFGRAESSIGEDSSPFASAPVVRRSVSYQPIRRNARQPSIMLNRRESRTPTQHQLHLELVDEHHRRASDTNTNTNAGMYTSTATTPTGAAQRGPSEPSIAAPDSLRRMSFSNLGPLTLTGVSLVPTTSLRTPRQPQPQRADSMNRGLQGLLIASWSVGGTASTGSASGGGGGGLPAVRALAPPLSGGWAMAEDADAAAPLVPARRDDGASGGGAATPLLARRGSESSFGSAAVPGRPQRQGSQQESILAASSSPGGGASPASPSAAGAAAATASAGVTMTPLLPAVQRRRSRGCTEHGGWRAMVASAFSAVSKE